MKTTAVVAPGRLLGLDFVRVVALLGVVLYHSAAAYSTNTPYWSVHDGASAFATGIRELVDVFIMPIFFFLAGYFTLSSLRKRGNWSFFKSKFWELGYIWLLAIIIILPVAYWGINVKSAGSSEGFISTWTSWISGIGQTRIGVATDPGQLVHMHFWFISLLLYFFVVFIFLRELKIKLFGNSANKARPESPSNRSTFAALMAFGLITTVGYYLSILLVPDTSWFTVKLFLQVQPAKLFLYVAYFGLGIYGYSRNWFASGNPLGRLTIWAPATVILAVAFLIVGQKMFLNAATTTAFSSAYLLLFALVRSLFLLSTLVALCSLAMKFFNRPIRLVRALADHSYYIYLIHIFPVSILQDVLMIWPQGSAIVKILFIFLASTALSYALSRWVFRKLTIRHWVGRKVFRLAPQN